MLGQKLQTQGQIPAELVIEIIYDLLDLTNSDVTLAFFCTQNTVALQNPVVSTNS